MVVTLLTIGFLASIVHVYIFHLARCRYIETQFNQRYDILCKENRKLSAENEMFRITFDSMKRSAVQTERKDDATSRNRTNQKLTKTLGIHRSTR